MTLQKSTYTPAKDLKAAEALLKENKNAALLAGGTDLMGLLKDEVHKEPPELLIGLKGMQDLNYIKVESDGVHIGALTTLSTIAKHPELRKSIPLLTQAAASVASPQIRNVATIAGNLSQEPRCWYYRNPGNTFDCLRKGGHWCDALFAENRYHSIFGAMNVNAAPCTTGCPIHNDIPAYMEQLREGNMEEAVKILLRTNPLAAITGRVCSHYCEEDCNRNDFDESVSIRSVERSLGDTSLAHADVFYPAPETETGKSTAVVGAGPAGLTAAYYLRKQGHAVTVYDQMPEAGGMLTYSIPSYRMPKEIVRSQVRALEGMGIKFKLGVAVGSEGLTLEDLRKGYDSLFLATGLWTGRKLRMENAELLDSGLEFLIDVQKGKAKPVGERVLVIGGGSVAVDVAIGAKRSGAKEVTMACLESLEIMPAVPEDLEQAHEESIHILPSWGPQRVIEKNGKLAGLELVRCTTVFNAEGRFAPSFDPSVTKTVEVDQVLVAIGQAADLSYLDGSMRNERGLIAANRQTYATRLEGVFAGGDVTGGSAVVVQAMAEGRRAAEKMGEYLGSPAPSHAVQHQSLKVNSAALLTSKRVESRRPPAEQRTLRDEDIQNISEMEISREAHRCANCGCVAVNASDLATAIVALDAEIRTNKRILPASQFFTTAENRTTVLDQEEIIEEIWIPAPQGETRQVYLKFRIRNAIDFPIVGVAFWAELKDGMYQNARIVLGAVAPIPLKAVEVEKLLEGRTPDEKLAAEAADLAVKQANPLARNKAKVEIVKALVRKAVLPT